MQELFTPENLVALLTLTSLEIVLGIDNVVFIAIVVGKLPENERQKARQLGLGFAMVSRILLLFALSWLMSVTEPLFQISSKGFSLRDVILFVGGMFLLAKATHEIHTKVEGEPKGDELGRGKAKSFMSVIIQIAFIDIIFSLDSVITAVGLSQSITIMVIAIVTSVLVMLLFAKKISDFVDTHPTLKMLALSFLLMIGLMLVAESFGTHIERGYIYFAMGFSLLVECLNIKAAKQTTSAH